MLDYRNLDIDYLTPEELIELKNDLRLKFPKGSKNKELNLTAISYAINRNWIFPGDKEGRRYYLINFLREKRNREKYLLDPVFWMGRWGTRRGEKYEHNNFMPLIKEDNSYVLDLLFPYMDDEEYLRKTYPIVLLILQNSIHSRNKENPFLCFNCFRWAFSFLEKFHSIEYIIFKPKFDNELIRIGNMVLRWYQAIADDNNNYPHLTFNTIYSFECIVKMYARFIKRTDNWSMNGKYTHKEKIFDLWYRAFNSKLFEIFEKEMEETNKNET